MTLEHLPGSETIRQCLGFVLECDELEGAFAVRMGVTRAEVAALLRAWPRIDDRSDDSVACLAVNNALNEVCHGLHIGDDEWTRWFTVDRATIRDTYRAWAAARGWRGTGLR